jgi:hypothetical protein
MMLMRVIRLLRTLSLVLVWVCLTSCERRLELPSIPELSARQIASPVEQSSSAVEDVFRIVKVVPLSGGPNIGAADVVRVNGAGHLFVGDFGATAQIHEFTSDGAYISSYGIAARSLSPEQTPSDFVLSGTRLFVLYGRDLAVIHSDGSITDRTFLPYVPHSMTGTSEGFCIAGVKGTMPQAVFCYNAEGHLVNSFHGRDPRLDLYRATPNRMLAALDNEIFAIEPFDPTLSRYTREGKLLSRTSLPSLDTLLPELFARPRPLSQETRFAIRANMHRFVTAWAFKNSVALIEAHNATKLWALVLFDTSNGTFTRWPSLNIHGTQVGPLRLQQVVGAFDDGLIVSAEAAGDRSTSPGTSSREQPQLVFLTPNRSETSHSSKEALR